MSIESSDELIYSDLAADPEMLTLVELFVAELPDRAQAMLQCEQREDWSELGRLAHQLKGACGSYGFHRITDYAAQLESACRPPQRDEIVHALDLLQSAIRRARSE